MVASIILWIVLFIYKFISEAECEYLNSVNGMTILLHSPKFLFQREYIFGNI